MTHVDTEAYQVAVATANTQLEDECTDRRRATTPVGRASLALDIKAQFEANGVKLKLVCDANNSWSFE